MSIYSIYNTTPNIEESIKKSIKGVGEKTKDINILNRQADTGQRYKDFVEVSRDGKLTSYLNLDRELYHHEQLQQSNAIIFRNTEDTSQALNTINNIVNDINSNLSAYDGNDPQILRGYLGTIQSILNSESTFNGYDVNDKAVGDIVSQSNLVNNVPTANYALTSQQRTKYTIDGSYEIQPNLVASEECFVKIIGAVHLALQGNDNLEQSRQILNDGQRLLHVRMTEIENNAKLLNQSTNNSQTRQQELGKRAKEQFSVDPFTIFQYIREKGRSIQISMATTKLMEECSLINLLN